MKLEFTKMEGCGNDYIYISGFTQNVPRESKPALARRLSDRHFGIGGDGVIFINPSDIADFEMEMYNMDGSRAQMCGNGIRCVGKYVYDRGMTDGAAVFTVESMGRIKTLEMTVRDGTAQAARVNMGAPVWEPSDIPVTAPAGVHLVQDEPIGAGGVMFRMTCVSMGNPHAVIVLSQEEIAAWYAGQMDGGNPAAAEGIGSPAGTEGNEGPAAAEGMVSLMALDISKIGPLLEHHPRFPERINTEFIQILDRGHMRMRVWERGSGETLACGTGACASAAACILGGLVDRRVEVELRGGRLMIEWDEESGDIYLTGPAAEVFTGTAEVGLCL